MVRRVSLSLLSLALLIGGVAAIRADADDVVSTTAVSTTDNTPVPTEPVDPAPPGTDTPDVEVIDQKVPADGKDKPAAGAKAETAGVAVIPLKGSYPEAAPAADLFGSSVENLNGVLNRLRRAKTDDSIDAVLLTIDEPTLGWGTINELQTVIAEVRAAGKPVHAYLDSMSTRSYLLATACDSISAPESGMWMVLGVRAEVTFYKNLFDKLDIQPDMLRMGKYKAAAEPYTRTEMSPAFREEMQAIVDDYFEHMVESIAEARGLKPAQVTAAIDSAPLTVEDAKAKGLLDHIAYPDEVEAKLFSDLATEVTYTRNYGKKKVDTDFSGLGGLVKMMNLMMGVEPRKRASTEPKIAVIYASGTIMTGKSTASLLSGDVLGSDTIVKAVKTARDDDTVKAIVLRIDSPGGSALASDLMWRALEQCEKPFVVSMGNTAASGGYYIAMGADKIFAEPGTLTGSIGVVGGKLGLKGLMNKVGVTTSVVSRGKNAGVMSPLEGFSESEREAMMRMLAATYKQFVSKAAAGRDMTFEELDKLAGGRVYTGRMAVENGLVDELGTLADAIAEAKTLAGLKVDTEIERLELPKPVSPFEALFGSLDAGVSSETVTKAATAHATDQMLRELSPELSAHLRALKAVTVLSQEPRLTVLPFRVDVK